MSPRAAPRRPRAPLRARPLSRGAWALLEDRRLADVEVVDLDDLPQRTGASGWHFEPMLAGARVLVARHDDSVAIVTEARRSIAREVDRLCRALSSSAALPTMFVAEGLLVALGADGRPSLDALRRALAAGGRDVLLLLCDVHRVDQLEVSGEPLAARRGRLSSLTDLPACVAVMSSLGVDVELARRATADVKLDGLLARPAGALDARATCLAARRDDAAPPARTSLSPPPAVTNASKVLFPRDGLTKEDLFSYYADVAPLLLPHMQRRPVVLQRWPDGIDDFMWFQHRVPPRAPDYLRAVMIEGNRRIAIDGKDALLWLVNQAAITFHGFVSREDQLDHPDWIILDLDPPEDGAWAHVVEVALAVRKFLELLEVESVVKTSGQKGLHVLVPLAPGQRALDVKLAGKRMADMIERLLPERATQEQDRAKRRGRVFLDANQGYVGKTLVLPYSVRGVDGAPVSTPVRWDEVTPSLSPRSFDLRTLRARLDREGDLARGLLAGRAEVGRILARLPA